MRKAITILFSSLFLSGCIGLTPSEDPTRFYLIAPPSTLDPSNSSENGLRLGIRRIEMPEYLNSSKMVVRRGGHEIFYSEINRWGEGIEQSVSRTIARSLEQSSEVGFVSVFPWPAEMAHDYLLRLSFSRFEGSDSGDVGVAGEWALIDQETRRVLRLKSFKMEGKWDTNDYGSLAATLSELVFSLGKEISEEIIVLKTEVQSGQPVSRNSQGN